MTWRTCWGCVALALICGGATGGAERGGGSPGGLALVRDGKALMEIVVPSNATASVRAAAEELQYHVRKATGATLTIRPEGDEASGAPAVCLGPCRRTLEAGVTTEGLKANGWRIRSAAGSLFVYGDDGKGDPRSQVDQSVFSDSGDPFRSPKYSTYARTGTLFGVYDLLEREMGVRWLWPGELGEVIPRSDSLILPEQNAEFAPRFSQKRWLAGYVSGSDPGWRSQDAAKAYRRSESVWLRRHRFAQEEMMAGAHGFADWWARFGQTRPEWFALMPDGSRGIDRYQRDTVSHAIAMCVSNEELRREFVEEWRKSGHRCVNAGENDVNGRCVCPGCMAMDMRDEPVEERQARARRAFEEQTEANSRWQGWPLVLGSLSDRYAQFWLKVQADVRSARPDALVCGCAYANWLEPPVKTRLNDGIAVQMVPDFFFPFTEERREGFRRLWQGWRATGCVLFHRPNYTLSGHNFPIFYARKLGEDLAWQARNGMIGAMFDSLTGQWATQGPNHYVVARMMEQPELPVQQALQEYYAAFGPAAGAVEAYFRHWERVSDGLTEDLLRRNPDGRYDHVNSWGNFYRMADVLFTPPVMSEGRAFLEKAQAQATGDQTAEARVSFLANGLRNAELTLAVEAARREGEKSGDMTRFVAALREVDEFRAAHESEGIANMFFLWRNETKGNKSGAWDRGLLP